MNYFSPITYGDEHFSVPISRGEKNIATAFEALRKTENDGADVSRLIDDLNNAVDLLNDAKLSFINNDEINALKYLTESMDISNSVRDDAHNLGSLTRKQLEVKTV